LQWQLDDQLANAQSTAQRAGMELGIMQDLAVGVNPNDADAWAMQDVLRSASQLAHRPTSSTSSARTGRSRRGVPINS